jgi:uncharacterized MAPEG superfamily protein
LIDQKDTMTALQALLGFTAWTLALIGLVFGYRGLAYLKGTPITHWQRGVRHADDPALLHRIEDAHANCLENLPVFAVLVLVAATQGKLASIDVLAACVFYCRVAQSLMHLWGTGSLQVHLRAIFWAGQLALFVMMFLRLLA